jgi:hypothetical protein
MRRSEQDRLLDGLLAQENLDALRRTSLQAGLVALRHRRFRRRAVQACAFAGLPVLALFFGLQWFSSVPKQIATAPLPEREGKLVSAEDQPTKMISDEELFALFPNRPLALVGKPGHQQLVFLDQRPSN